MIRNFRNYTIQLRKDGRYTARVTDQGHTHCFYGKTKKEVQQKLEVFIDELNTTAQLKYEMEHPTKYTTLKSWAYLCLNTYCIANIQGNTYAAYERLIRLHLGELGDIPVGRITSLMIQNVLRPLSEDTQGSRYNRYQFLHIASHLRYKVPRMRYGHLHDLKNSWTCQRKDHWRCLLTYDSAASKGVP